MSSLISVDECRRSIHPTNSQTMLWVRHESRYIAGPDLVHVAARDRDDPVQSRGARSRRGSRRPRRRTLGGEVRGGVGDASTAAGRAEAAPLATERDDTIETAAVAVDP